MMARSLLPCGVSEMMSSRRRMSSADRPLATPGTIFGRSSRSQGLLATMSILIRKR